MRIAIIVWWLIVQGVGLSNDAPRVFDTYSSKAVCEAVEMKLKARFFVYTLCMEKESGA